MREYREVAQVAVIGAGLAGLNAARLIEQEGHVVIVLEATDEVGGNLRTRELGGMRVDLGAEFVGRVHKRVRSLVSIHGLSLEGGVSSGPVLWRLGGEQLVSRWPTLSPRDLLTLVTCVVRLARLARSVDPLCPERSDRTPELDRISFDEWLRACGASGKPRALLVTLLEGFASKPADQISLLQVAWWARRAGGVVRALRSGSSLRISRGAQTLPLAMAHRLREPVRLRQPVATIRVDEEQVVIRCSDEEEFWADGVVVATSVPAGERIVIDPPTIGGIADQSGYAQATKVAAVVRFEPVASHRLVIGGTHLDFAWRRGRCLSGIGRAGSASVDELVAELTSAFGARDVVASDASCWAQEIFSGRCYLAAAPGILSGRVLRTHSESRIAFAAAEESSWPSAMEGALESGELAAERVLAAVGKGR